MLRIDTMLEIECKTKYIQVKIYIKNIWRINRGFQSYRDKLDAMIDEQKEIYGAFCWECWFHLPL